MDPISSLHSDSSDKLEPPMPEQKRQPGSFHGHEVGSLNPFAAEDVAQGDQEFLSLREKRKRRDFSSPHAFSTSLEEEEEEHHFLPLRRGVSLLSTLNSASSRSLSTTSEEDDQDSAEAASLNHEEISSANRVYWQDRYSSSFTLSSWDDDSLTQLFKIAVGYGDSQDQFIAAQLAHLLKKTIFQVHQPQIMPVYVDPMLQRLARRSRFQRAQLGHLVISDTQSNKYEVDDRIAFLAKEVYRYRLILHEIPRSKQSKEQVDDAPLFREIPDNPAYLFLSCMHKELLAVKGFTRNSIPTDLMTHSLQAIDRAMQAEVPLSIQRKVLLEVAAVLGKPQEQQQALIHGSADSVTLQEQQAYVQKRLFQVEEAEKAKMADMVVRTSTNRPLNRLGSWVCSTSATFGLGIKNGAALLAQRAWRAFNPDKVAIAALHHSPQYRSLQDTLDELEHLDSTDAGSAIPGRPTELREKLEGKSPDEIITPASWRGDATAPKISKLPLGIVGGFFGWLFRSRKAQKDYQNGINAVRKTVYRDYGDVALKRFDQHFRWRYRLKKPLTYGALEQFVLYQEKLQGRHRAFFVPPNIIEPRDPEKTSYNEDQQYYEHLFSKISAHLHSAKVLGEDGEPKWPADLLNRSIVFGDRDREIGDLEEQGFGSFFGVRWNAFLSTLFPQRKHDQIEITAQDRFLKKVTLPYTFPEVREQFLEMNSSFYLKADPTHLSEESPSLTLGLFLKKIAILPRVHIANNTTWKKVGYSHCKPLLEGGQNLLATAVFTKALVRGAPLRGLVLWGVIRFSDKVTAYTVGVTALYIHFPDPNSDQSWTNWLQQHAVQIGLMAAIA